MFCRSPANSADENENNKCSSLDHRIIAGSERFWIVSSVSKRLQNAGQFFKYRIGIYQTLNINNNDKLLFVIMFFLFFFLWTKENFFFKVQLDLRKKSRENRYAKTNNDRFNTYFYKYFAAFILFFFLLRNTNLFNVTPMWLIIILLTVQRHFYFVCVTLYVDK